MPTLAEVRVGEERELERRDRALDRHLGDVDDEPSTLEALQRVVQRRRPVEGVEVEHLRAPQLLGHPGGLVGAGGGPGRDDELVVGELAPVGEPHDVLVGLDPVDLPEHQVDAVGQEPAPRAW
jgi:hypothetical protein